MGRKESNKKNRTPSVKLFKMLKIRTEKKKKNPCQSFFQTMEIFSVRWAWTPLIPPWRKFLETHNTTLNTFMSSFLLGTVILKSPPLNNTKLCILFIFHVVMKADVFIKYKIVFVDYDKRNSSEMEVCFFRLQKKRNIIVNSYICKFIMYLKCSKCAMEIGVVDKSLSWYPGKKVRSPALPAFLM